MCTGFGQLCPTKPPWSMCARRLTSPGLHVVDNVYECFRKLLVYACSYKLCAIATGVVCLPLRVAGTTRKYQIVLKLMFVIYLRIHFSAVSVFDEETEFTRSSIWDR